MSKPRSQVQDYLVYLAVRIFVCVVQALPLVAAFSLANGLAWILYRVDRRHRQVAIDNLRHAFGEQLDEDERQKLVILVYRHFCRLLIEIIHLPRRLHLNNWKDHVDLLGGRTIVNRILSDRPLLMVTGHYGNWELGGYVLGLLGVRSYAVARPLDNRYLDDFLRRFRERTGQKLLAKKGDFDQMQDIMQRGGVLATLGDQDAGQRGLFVDFFGRPASTHKAMALLALEYHVPVQVIVARNLGRPLEYCAAVVDEILPEDHIGRLDGVRAITQRLTTSLELAIRQDPAQYFWLHRRWKHQPRQGKRNAA